MGCVSSSDARLREVEAKLDRLLETSGHARGSRRTSLRTEGYDLFVSHAKKLAESEDRAVWIADILESCGFRPFFDRCELVEITEAAIEKAMLSSDVCVTVLDPFTFTSKWVFAENLLAANAGIPIVFVYDADRFRWDGQLSKWQRMYPWAFGRQVVPVSKSQRRSSAKHVLQAVALAASEGRQPPKMRIEAEMGGARLPVKVGVGGSRETETFSAVESAHKVMLSRLDGQQPSLIIVAFTCAHEAKTVANRVDELSPGVPMIGCTSCRGVVLNDTWLTYQKEFAIGMWGICDEAGIYTTIHIPERPEGLHYAVQVEVSKAAKTQRDRPSFVVLLGSPGDEEIVLDGISSALGSDVPILGGSSADNAVLGRWRQIAKVGTSTFEVSGPTVSDGGITIAVAWASCKTATTLTSGYRQTEHRGTVTKVDASDHGRTILEVDGAPIRDVYETWSRGAVTQGVEWKDGVANVLASSSFCPLGECDGDYVRVMHPSLLNSRSGALTTFADAREGMPITMLSAAPETLGKKISESAKGLLADPHASAASPGAFEVQEIVGALMIFCGGMVMAIDDAMPIAAEQLAEVVGYTNTMGICCFGEQGMNSRRRAIHGNLMFGCLLFSNATREIEDDAPIISV